MATKITGHRGFPLVAPENTLPSFAAAIAAGAERIELDLVRSRDGHRVVHHDYYLGRTSDGAGPVIDRDWEWLAALDAGSWFSEHFSRARLCRLDEVLDAFGSGVEYELEIKWPDEGFVRSIVQQVSDRGLLERVEFTSPHAPVLDLIRRLCPTARRGLFVQTYPEWMEATVGRRLAVGAAVLGGFALAHCPCAILDSALVESLHGAGVAVHASNCDDPESIRAALALGVAQLSTNDVRLAVQTRTEWRA